MWNWGNEKKKFKLTRCCLPAKTANEHFSVLEKEKERKCKQNDFWLIHDIQNKKTQLNEQEKREKNILLNIKKKNWNKIKEIRSGGGKEEWKKEAKIKNTTKNGKKTKEWKSAEGREES